MTAHDPLENADVGDTHTIGGSCEVHLRDLPGQKWRGSDREYEVELTNIDVFETADGNQVVAIDYDGEVMKTLPRRWDRATEPRTDAERKAERRVQLAKRLTSVGVAAGSIVFAVGVATWTTNQVAKSTTINGQAVGPIAPGEMATTLFVILIIAAVILAGLKGGFPGKVMRR